ncbi:hypothetical protein [Chitinophaga vietnamensis]|uniref:hypothetical protein n=1 Tax=Chitinophaga vietnamensis TaxID=2593957 RepID=UPI0011779B36|nr:hypothetical protein [Chitinophaga vietnamensis]
MAALLACNQPGKPGAAASSGQAPIKQNETLRAAILPLMSGNTDSATFGQAGIQVMVHNQPDSFQIITIIQNGRRLINHIRKSDDLLLPKPYIYTGRQDTVIGFHDSLSHKFFAYNIRRGKVSALPGFNAAAAPDMRQQDSILVFVR